MSLKIKQLPESARPYEKLKLYGASKLTDAELMAIIIKTGTKDENSVEIANRLISKIKILQNLQYESINELKQIKGIGDIKAIQLSALCEITKRMLLVEPQKVKVSKSKDVFDLLRADYKFEKQEIIKVLILNSKNYVEKIVDIVKGESNFAAVTAKQIYSQAVMMQAPKIIMAHNHPSGDTTPSEKDIEITKRMLNAAEILGIQFMDHVIITDNLFYSIVAYLNKKHLGEKIP